MKRMGVLKAGAIVLACLGMLVPTAALEPAAAASVDSKHATNDQVPAVIDVTLHDGGTLR